MSIFDDGAAGASRAGSSDGDGRQHTGGYDFGGYIPGEDYLPARRRNLRGWVASIVAVVVVAAVVVAYFM